MARKVTGGAPLGYSPEIDWTKWADGGQWELTRGVDFEQEAGKARRAFLSWASRRGVGTHSSVSPDGNVLTIQVVPREEGDEAAAERGEGPLAPGTYIDGVRVPEQREGEA